MFVSERICLYESRVSPHSSMGVFAVVRHGQTLRAAAGQPRSANNQTMRTVLESHRSICPRKSRGSFLSKSMSHHTCWVSLHLEHVEVEEDLVARSGVDEPMTLEGPVTLKKITGQKSSELR